MNDPTTLRRCRTSLEANGLRYGLLPLQNGVQLLLTAYGGRILGPFLDEESESLFWNSPALGDPDALAALLAARAWNLGGDRLWIGPEVQYNIHDRSDFWGSYMLPPQMDPGAYTLEQMTDAEWRLAQEVTLEAHNLASGRKTLHLERVVRPAADPLRHLAAYERLRQGVLYAGYEQVVTLTDRRPDEIMSQSWNLVQVRAGGEITIPASPSIEIDDYFEPIDDAHRRIEGGLVHIRISGRQRFKVGLQAAQLFGRIAYLNTLVDDRAVLIVRAFYNNPSAAYLEEPAHLPGRSGQSVHLYNDDGGLGGFGEIECQGQAVGGPLGRGASSDPFLLWLYVGERERIKAIAEQLT